MQTDRLSNEDLKQLIAENAKVSKNILELVKSNAKAIEANAKANAELSEYIRDVANTVVQLHTRVEEISPARQGGRSVEEEIIPQAAKPN